MLHGASIQPTVTETKPGVYLVSEVDLFMSGEWQLRTTIDTSVGATVPASQGTSAPTDHVGPIFQIP